MACILECLPTSALPDSTPFEAWHGYKPNLADFRVFGCRAYVHVGKDKRKSLESHSLNCIFLGFEPGVKGWKCYDPLARKVVISRDVLFDESRFPGLAKVPSSIPPC